MRNRLQILSLVVLVASVFGCDEQLPVEQTRNDVPIMPLAVGNRWIGRYLLFDTLGNNTTVGVDTLEIVSTVVRGAETWYVTNSGTLLITRGFSLFSAGASASLPEVQLAQHPSSIGDVFGLRQVVFRGDSARGDTLKEGRIVVAVNYAMTVQNGTHKVSGYRIHRVELNGMELDPSDSLWNENVMYFAPGVGLVRSDEFERGPSGFYRRRMWELLEVRVQ